MKRITLIILTLISSQLIFAQSTNQYVSVLNSSLWSQSEIPVCWENPSSNNEINRLWVKQAVKETWERYTNLKFTKWCPCNQDNSGIRIKIEDSGPHVKELGNNLRGLKDGMVLNFTFNNWCPNCKTAHGLENAIKFIAVHEFGHAIGFTHEHNRDDCTCIEESTQGTIGDWNITECDLNSVMNYCNPKWNNYGKLSDLDKQGAQYLYGEPNKLLMAVERAVFEKGIKIYTWEDEYTPQDDLKKTNSFANLKSECETALFGTNEYQTIVNSSLNDFKNIINFVRTDLIRFRYQFARKLRAIGKDPNKWQLLKTAYQNCCFNEIRDIYSSVYSDDLMNAISNWLIASEMMKAGGVIEGSRLPAPNQNCECQ